MKDMRLENNKDWTGNSRSTFSTLGASNHSTNEREKHDYYATDPVAIDALYKTGFFNDAKRIWEPAVGGGHLAERMSALGCYVSFSDLYDHGYIENFKPVDFLKCDIDSVKDIDAIVTNPPYRFALEFCEKCVELQVPKFAMFLKITFLEGQKRRKFFDKHPPRFVAVFTERVQCAINGDLEMFRKSSAACYAWFIWEKGYNGKPQILWLNKNNKEVKNG